MEYIKHQNQYLIRLDKDERLFDCLYQFVDYTKESGGFLSGIGALKEVTLGYYQLEEQTYIKKSFVRDHELLSLEGSLSWLDNKPFFHLHCLISGPDFSCMGGHLFEAKVAVTVELNFRPFDLKVERKANSDIGLNLLDLCKLE